MEFQKMIVLNVEMFGNSYKYIAEYEIIPQQGEFILIKPTKCYRLESDNKVKEVKIPRSYSKEEDFVYVCIEDGKVYYEKDFRNEIFDIIEELEKQLEEVKQVRTEQDLLNYKEKYKSVKSVNLIEEGKAKKKSENIEKCKEQITLYLKNNKDTFKLKNMLYDLKINNKTFYNYKLDEFIKNLEKN